VNAHQDADPPSRREFLRRLAAAGGAVAVASLGAWRFWDRQGPGRDHGERLVRLGDYSIPLAKPRISITRGADRAKTLGVGLAAMGGIETFISNGDRVLIKVNAAFASPPMLSATTHPRLVGELVRLCLKAGAASVLVTDNPINDPKSCFGLSGIAKAAASAGGKVILPTNTLFRPASLPGGRLIRNWPILYGPFEGVTKLIGVAPVKHHERSGASMTMKNWYGLLGGRRNTFHQDIHNIIKELAMLVRPTLVVLDGTTAMMRNGPTGGSLDDLKETHTMIISTDQVAADAFGATLLGKTAADLPYIQKAEAAGVGIADYESLGPVYAEAT